VAILTSPLVDRHGTEPAQPAKGRRRSLVVDWLAHPQASFYLVLVPAVLLLVLGMMMVLSASSVYAYVRWDGDSYYFVKRQAVFLLVGGAFAYLLAKRTPTQLKVFGWLLMGAALVLQVLTFTPLGYSNNGNTNWVNLGVSWFNIQPSELAKLAIVVWGADVFARKEKLLGDVKHLLIPFLPVSLVLIGLVVLQSDLGTGMILGAIVLAVLWYVGASWKVLVSLIGGVAAAVGILILTTPYRMSRILGFFNPELDPLGVNHQPIRAVFALASGGWWGLGLGESRQKWGGLVESHTDYILAVIGEELGLVGTLSVLALLLIIGYAGFRIAMRADLKFCRFTAAGITSWFMIQALVNVAVVFRMMPVLGVPLPLLSYGGSALLANLMALGVLLACARQEPAARAYTERNRSSRRKTLVTTAVGSKS
jgi:cell division protein FtsW